MKLNLDGINLSDIHKKKPKEKKLIIDVPQTTVQTSNIHSRYLFIFAVIICIYLINIIVSWSLKHPTVSGSNLRRILRMKCATSETETQCSAPHSGGDYVVNIDGCKDVFEFNGIPWTELKVDNHNNFRVPSTSDLTLIVKNPCEHIIATIDTSVQSNTQYASRAMSLSEKYIKKIVWISDDCHTEFTLKIDNVMIFDKTPEKMIDSKVLNKKKAYTYEPDSDISGSISVEGKGCIKPIIIYTLRF